WSHCFGYSPWPASHLYVADITGGPADNTIVVDSGSSSVCLATVGGYSQMLAGNWEGNVGFGGDGGPAYEAMLDHPQAAVTDDAGNVFIADTGNRRIRKVSAEDGIITTIAGTGLAGFNGDGIP